MTDEEYVRARWEHVRTGAAALHLSDYSAPLVITHAGEFPNWSAARAFTEQREREIAEVREEISEIEDDILSYSSHDNADSFAVIYRRILARLQARLAELRRGMKEGSE
jgi:hypothetical protein